MKSILLVDDSDAARDAYALILEWAGFEILVAENGRQAYEVARSRRPDLVVMDLNMPVLSGWDAARELKRDPATADIPLIALSAWPVSEQDRCGLEECGFSAVWTKPFPPSAMLEEIRQRLEVEAQAA
jgi:two-component system cell cycle response regulator DivK